MELNIDDLESLNNEKCYNCGIELNDSNLSMWEGIIEGNKTFKQCVICNEISNRLLSSCKKEGDQLVPQKTELEIRTELKQENLTIEILKALEEIKDTSCIN